MRLLLGRQTSRYREIYPWRIAKSPQTKTTEPFHPLGGYVPGIGLAPKLSAAVFSLSKPGEAPAAPIDESDTSYVFVIKTRERARARSAAL